ncbi:MAG: PQQ-binding-like beta-propeller repeat protein, partial [Abditibacteriota bacterium]|nr:PQQ-binding-like beta-propeller repeat protein [Abditibacteriota bacterium]
ITCGNHDSSWSPTNPYIIRKYGGAYYSFEKCGCKFIMLNSAGLLDPRPTLKPEALEWLRKELVRTGPDKPVFLCLHHWLFEPEFSSLYESRKLMDIILPYNIVAILTGHYHCAELCTHEGIPQIGGGSTYGPNDPGFMVYSVKDNVLTAAYNQNDGVVKEIYTASIVRNRYQPKIDIQTPENGITYDNDFRMDVTCSLGEAGTSSVKASIDGKKEYTLTRVGGHYEAPVDIDEVGMGAHYITVTVTDPDGTEYNRSGCFYIDKSDSPVVWRTNIGASSRTAPVVTAQSLFVGTNDGRMYAFERESGKQRWVFKTPEYGAVTTPIVLNGTIMFGSESGKFYCLNGSTGKKVWEFDADIPELYRGGGPCGRGEAIYSTPATNGVQVYFAANNGSVHCLEASDGSANWLNDDAQYNVESALKLHDGNLFYGSWDTKLYCVDASTSQLNWSAVGVKASDGKAPRFYSPADCGPVIKNGKVYIADRGFMLGVYDEKTGKLLATKENVAGVGESDEGMGFVYLRMKEGVVKMDNKEEEIWRSDAATGIVPTAPVVSEGKVYVCSNKGLVSAIDEQSGEVKATYKATPDSFVLVPMAAYKDTCYVLGVDGSLTALRFK